MLGDFILCSLAGLGVIFILVGIYAFIEASKVSKKKSNDVVTIDVSYDDKTRDALASLNSTTPTVVEDDSFENDELVMTLLKFDDDRLIEIIENSLLYRDECRDKARKILARRTSWEKIKEYTDTDLMRIITTDKDLYDDSMKGAASMELYNRHSPLLFKEIRSMSYSTITDIADGKLKTPEGIRLAAKRYLSQN
ncbi:MAG: hypothetical protein HDS61_01075 [Barnesiella sp.]|nr:hypothetical protein [Barnesiella sp.]MBD5257589.1 hypothetical protein [Barnesiella sp.]